MSDRTEFDIGSAVACRDGVCGDLRGVIVDPMARSVTHLVVEPSHRRGGGHLVPIETVASTGKEIRLTCTKAQFNEFEDAEEAEYMPAEGGQGGFAQDGTLLLPYYALRPGGLAMHSAHGRTGPHESAHDHVPLGEVEVRRGEQVHATDGTIGRVEGLVIDPSDHHVTHFLLQEGHLWGQKRVAIPISAVTRPGDGVRIKLTKDEVRDLPPVDFDHPV